MIFTDIYCIYQMIRSLIVTKAESIYSELTNKASEVTHLGADSIRFSGNWEMTIRTLNAVKKEYETRLNRALRMNLSDDRMNVLRIVGNSIDNEEKRLRPV